MELIYYMFNVFFPAVSVAPSPQITLPLPPVVDEACGLAGNSKWPGGVVPYTVGPDLESIHEIIKNAIQEFAEKTCVRFLPKTLSDEDFVQFTQYGGGCGSAHVCRIGGFQNIWIGKSCMDHSTVTHEMGHTIGMMHEQHRPGWDRYITIDYAPADCNWWTRRDSYSTLGLMYDYLSVMHDDSCDSPDLKPKLPGVSRCSSDELSVLDAEKVNLFYNCGGCHSYRFRPHNWTQVEPFVAGTDSDGMELGVCRAYVNGSIVPGKKRRHEKRCHIPFASLEHEEVDYFEVLAYVDIKIFGWHSMEKGQTVPLHSIAGGRTADGVPLYIGRCNTWAHSENPNFVPGRIDQGRMFYSYGGKEYECEKFQVLRCLNKN